MNNWKPILCLDFDGVLHSYTSGWKGADVVSDPPVPGAMQFLLLAVDHFTVNVHSSRSHQGGINAMKRFIAENMNEHEQNPKSSEEGFRWVHEFLTFPEHKPPALITLDDRAITFTGLWPNIPDLLAFKPWNKK